MEEQFRHYLERTPKKNSMDNYTENTINSYVGSIPKISKKYNKDIYQIQSISELRKIRDELNTGGLNEELGSYSKKTVYNAMARYVEFFEERSNSRNLPNNVISEPKVPIAQPQTLKQQLTKLLVANKNLVLTGAPGTGKTFLAKQIAKEFTGNNEQAIEFVQFHSSYDYTDFVEGLRPVASNEQGGANGFALQDGIFKKFCKRAAEDPGQDYVFIIDEINRAEPSRVLGELFFAIEPGYRGIKGKVQTQYANLNDEVMEGLDEGEEGYFYVPDNVYIIGTMNDIDRNVDSMDFAMRRRFVWKEILASETAEDMFEQLSNDNVVDFEPFTWRAGAKNKMDSINKYIDKELPNLGKAYHIGPAYFLKISKYIEKDNDWDKSWNALWNYHIQPLLGEYLRGMPDKETHLEAIRYSWDNNKYISLKDCQEIKRKQ